jgi:glycosyltransferase involved in cell wall biosynthesis
MPAHNEQAYLVAAVDQVVFGLRDRPGTFEVLICENGSTDRTADVAAKLAERFAEVSTMSLPAPDYGGALRAGFLAATGDLVANFDVDYIDLDFLDAAVALAESPGGPVAVVASKRSAGATDTRSIGRRMVTAVFSSVLRHGFGLKVSDTHGMKLLRRGDVAAVVETCRFGTDLFDTELILRIERAGLRVGELPATVTDTRPPRTPITTRIPRSLVGLARLRVALWQEVARR